MDARTKETIRYLGYGRHAVDDKTLAMIRDSFEELEQIAGRRIICRIFELSRDEGNCLKLGELSIESNNLYKNLNGCEEVLMLGATLGTGVDQLIKRYSLMDMAKAVILQAAAAAMLEEYLDEWQAHMKEKLEAEGKYLRPRFSPGYGDFSITHQKKILEMLDAPKKIGLSMTESYMLTPTKSVTAVIGISRTDMSCHKYGCEMCGKLDCIYRRN